MTWSARAIAGGTAGDRKALTLKLIMIAAALLLSSCATLPSPMRATSVSPTAIGLNFGDAQFGRADIISAETRFSPNGMPVINVTLGAEGRARLSGLTRANVGQELPLSVDGNVLSTPKIMEPIEGGQFQIAGGFSLLEAHAMAARILGKKPK